MSEPSNDVTIVVMGPTGSGKSTFINMATTSNLVVSSGLESCTSAVELSSPFEWDGRLITLIDTPGFNDTNKTDSDILKDIAAYLENTYKRNKKLHGVIYMHPICEIRMGGISKRNFWMFKKLCGEDSLKNVVIVTNLWGNVSTSDGETREAELISNPKFFKPALDHGAKIRRHHNTIESAHNILREIVHNHPIALTIQKELVDEEKGISQTAAGREIDRVLAELMEKYEKDIADMRQEMQDALAAKDDRARKEIEEERQRVYVELDRLRNESQSWATRYVEEKKINDKRLSEMEGKHMELVKQMVEHFARDRKASEQRRKEEVEANLDMQHPIQAGPEQVRGDHVAVEAQERNHEEIKAKKQAETIPSARNEQAAPDNKPNKRKAAGNNGKVADDERKTEHTVRNLKEQHMVDGKRGSGDAQEQDRTQAKSQAENPEQNETIPRLQREAAAKLKAELNDMALIRYLRISFMPSMVRIEYRELPTGFATIPPMPISVKYQGKIIAEALNQRPLSVQSTLSTTLRITDENLYAALILYVLQHNEAKVVLINEECSRGIYPKEKDFLFKGMGLSKKHVQLNYLTLLGSDKSGRVVNAEVTASITNPSQINIKGTEWDMEVYYLDAKIGHTKVKGFDLLPGANKQRSNWTFEPTSNAEEKLQRFLCLYLTTSESIPISLRIRAMRVSLCSSDLPPFEMHATIRGLPTRLVRDIHASIGKDSKFCFRVEFENPTGSPLTITDIDVVASIKGTDVCNIKHTFRFFTIPKIEAGGKLGRDIWGDVFGHTSVEDLTAAQNVALEISTSVSVCIDKFPLRGLKFDFAHIALRQVSSGYAFGVF